MRKRLLFLFQLFKKMGCFWSLYRKYCELNIGKNWIIDLKRNDRCCQIKIICNKVDINTCNQLKILANSYNDYDIKNYGFDNFVVKEIITVKKVIVLLSFLLATGCKNANIT